MGDNENQNEDEIEDHGEIPDDLTDIFGDILQETSAELDGAGDVEVASAPEPISERAEAEASDSGETVELAFDSGAEEPADPGAEGPADADAVASETESEADGDAPEEKKGRRRRRRDPLANMEPVSSTAAGLKPRELASLSELKRVKKARVRHEGKRVVTDDVRKLKSLSIEPQLSRGEYVNYYVEPVRIEYYIPKESRFAVETKFLYIPLMPPTPREQDDILRDAIEQNTFVDLIDVMNRYPQHITDVLESYANTMDMFERLSNTMKDVYEGREEQLKTAYYIAEVLLDYEPTIAALEFLGDFMTYNVIWLIRQLNLTGIEFAASDKMVSLFIKMRNIYWEENQLPYDERFEILAALFFEQAFPNRGALVQTDDYYLDIFDPRHRSL